MFRRRAYPAALVLAVASTLLTGCANATDTGATPDAADTTATPEFLPTSADETSFPVKAHVDLDETLCDTDQLKVKATGFGPVQYYVSLDLEIENTSDVPLEINVTRSSLNGWTWDALLVTTDDGNYNEVGSITIEPGETKRCGLGFSNEMYLVPCEIEQFATIGFTIEGYDTSGTNPLVNTGPLMVTLPDAQTYTQHYNDSGDEVYHEGGIRVVSKGITDNGFGEYVTDFYIENLTDDGIIVTPTAITVDGQQLPADDLYSFAEVSAGERTIANPSYGFDVHLTKDSVIEIALEFRKANLDSFYRGVDDYQDLPLVATTPTIRIGTAHQAA